MIPILYSTSETAFTSNGLGRLVDCISCYVTEELNGIYEVEFQYPVFGRLYNEMVTNGGIISVTHDDNGDRQSFDIYKYTAPIDGIVTFNARHISYRLSGIVVKPFTATSCADAVSKIVTNSMQTNPFSFSTDKAVNTGFTLDKPMSARAILGGTQGSLLDVYGKGEYKFDNWNVYLYVNRGQQRDVTVRYGKNLTEFQKEHSESDIFNAIVPFWQGGDGNVVWLNDTVVATGQSVKWAVPQDFSSDFQDAPTIAQLRTRAENYLADNTPWVPDENITFNFVQLWQTQEYANIAALERVGLADTISVVYPALGVTNASAKIIKVVYDVLNDRFSSMEVGKLQTTLADAILAPYTDQLSNVQTQIKEYVPSSGGKFTGDIEFGGFINVKNRSSTKNLSAIGWYRVLRTGSPTGDTGTIIDLNITRTTNNTLNEVHYVRLKKISSNIEFSDESSFSNTQIIDKVRYTKSSNYGYVDIHYNSSATNTVCVDFDVSAKVNQRKAVVSSGLTSVADSPTGETVVEEYTLHANGTGDINVTGTVAGQGFADLLFGLGNKIVSNTDCNTIQTEGKYTCPSLSVGGTLLNAPYSSAFGMLVLRVSGVERFVQIAIPNSTTITIKIRYFDGSSWTEWKTITPA